MVASTPVAIASLTMASCTVEFIVIKSRPRALNASVSRLCRFRFYLFEESKHEAISISSYRNISSVNAANQQQADDGALYPMPFAGLADSTDAFSGLAAT